ncbi:universal stress protein [Crocinitomix catalasitica]|uniref:universal stress protein n=1 Tax=Crocinitomix catalasitica TaxID=184607 RepID=UPI00048213F0|nr:universal stress protein [Crocinitomix catalasitica]
MERRSILVPHDFTAVADNAVKYALKLAASIHANVDLVHIVKDSSQKAKAKQEFEKLKLKLTEIPAGVIVNTHAVVGSIYTEIASTAADLKSTVIIMGTHGAKGMQKLFGSFAIKVITSTHVPFLVVQDNYTGYDTSKIVVPIDESQESLQIAQVAAGLSDILKSEIHIVSEKKLDSNLKLKTAVHSGLLAKQFKEKNLVYVNKVLDRKKGYSTDIVNYTIEVGANLIAFAYHSDALLPQFDTFAQSLITNKSGVPVLVLNSKEAGNYFF